MNVLSQFISQRESLNPLAAEIAIVGYGNDLRGDDGVGPQVATIFAGRRLPGVRSLPLHQLTPELAPMLASVKLAIFVDAYPVDAGSTAVQPEVQVRSLAPLPSGAMSGHTSDPQGLLMLAQLLYDRAPQAWLVAIPAVNFELGDRLSTVARWGATRAASKIECLLENYWQQEPAGDWDTFPSRHCFDNFSSTNPALL